MKAKLIKRGENDYKLFVNDAPFGQSKQSPYSKLSLKNCEAMELMEGKKFSEGDMILFGEYCRSDFDGLLKTKDLYNEYQSLQQTEWDVAIEMEWMKSYSILGNPHQIPKLDADGCLILKRM